MSIRVRAVLASLVLSLLAGCGGDDEGGGEPNTDAGVDDRTDADIIADAGAGGPDEGAGWTEFTPTPLDESEHPAADPMQPGTRLVYVSKERSPVRTWDAAATYAAGDVVFFPVVDDGGARPEVREAFWEASGSQEDGTEPSADAGWTAVPDPGVVYYWNGEQVVDADGTTYGSDPFEPEGIVSFYTYGIDSPEASAWGHLRHGFADWCLFARGETWTTGEDMPKGLRAIEGRSAEERSLHGAFGPLSEPRPTFLQHPSELVIRIFHNGEPSRGAYAFASLRILPVDPAAEQRGGCVGMLGAWNEDVLAEHILFEDIHCDGMESGFTIQWRGREDTRMREFNFDVTIRRSVVAHTWAVDHHNQGVFLFGIHSLTLEDNFFLKNGYKKDPRIDDTARTIYDRNFYLSLYDQMGVTMRNTVSANGGSGGPQMRSGGLIERTLILNEGYAFAGAASGKNPAWSRAQEGTSAIVRDNVMFKWKAQGTDDDRAHPGWGYTVKAGSFGVEMTGNIISGRHLVLNDISNRSRSINLEGSEVESGVPTIGNVISGNISYLAGPIRIADSTSLEDNRIEDNIVATEGEVVSINGSSDTVFADNAYYTDAEAPFSTDEGDLTHEAFASAGYVDVAGGSTVASLDQAAIENDWPDPDRSMRSYLEGLGHSVTSADGVPEYIEACLAQRRGNWDPALESVAVINYVREGFGLAPVP